MTRRLPRPAAMALVVLGLMLAVCGCSSSATRGSAHAGDGSEGAAYVALGDSYTAFPGTTTQVSAACLRSSRNYPHLLAAALGYHLRDMSCSSATTLDFTEPQNAGAPPQFSALSPKTRLVTVSIGANNAQLSTLLLGGCIQFRSTPAASGNPCELRTFPEAVRALELLVPTLTATYEEVRRRAPHARVIVVDYPQILGTSGACAAFPVAPGDVPFINAINRQLNDAERRSAAAAGLEFVDIAAPSMSHGICSRDPWINGIKWAFGRAFPMHPFANEQQAVARLLEARLQADSRRSAAP